MAHYRTALPVLLLSVFPGASVTHAAQGLQPRDVVPRQSDVPAGFARFTSGPFTPAQGATATSLSTAEASRDGFRAGYTTTFWNSRNARAGGRGISYIYSTAILFSSPIGARKAFLAEQKADLGDLRHPQSPRVLRGVPVGRARYAFEFDTVYNSPVTVALVVFWRNRYVASIELELRPGTVQQTAVEATLRRLGHIMNHRISTNQP